MPKRKLINPSNKTLDAIREVHGRGVPLSEDEATKIRSGTYLLRSPTLPSGPTITKAGVGKKGEFRVWEAEHPKGPGRQELPLARKLQEMERDFLTKVAIARRRAPVEAASKVRVSRSRRTAIQQAWKEIGFDTPHAAKRIAKKLNVSASYVRKIRAEMRLTEGNQ